MAEAYGKLTGRPGICIVTRGPGATHAAVGVHTAFQDSTPMILLIGQVRRARRSARRSRRSTTGGCSGRWRSGSRRSTAPTGSPSSSPRAYTTAVRRAGPARSCSRCPRTCSPRRATQPTRRRSSASSASPAAARHRVAARPARGSRAAVRDHRRRGLGRRARRRPADASSKRTHLPVGRGVPPAGLARQRLAELRRRRRHRHQSGARRARARRRRAARRRAAPRRDDRPPATRCSTCRRPADARARASGRRGARPRLPGGSADPLGHGAVRARRSRDLRVEAALARLDGRPRGRLRSLAAARRAMPGARRPRRLSSRTCARACPRRDRLQRRGQLHASGCTASGAIRSYPSQLAPTSGAMGYGVPAAIAAEGVCTRSATVVCFAGDG